MGTKWVLGLKARKIEIGTKAGLPLVGTFRIMQGVGLPSSAVTKNGGKERGEFQLGEGGTYTVFPRPRPPGVPHYHHLPGAWCFSV